MNLRCNMTRLRYNFTFFELSLRNAYRNRNCYYDVDDRRSFSLVSCVKCNIHFVVQQISNLRNFCLYFACRVPCIVVQKSA